MGVGGWGEKDGWNKKKRETLIKNVEVFMFLIKPLDTSVCSNFSYLATVI